MNKPPAVARTLPVSAGLAGLLAALACACAHAPGQTQQGHQTTAEVLAASVGADWRAPDPQATLVLELAAGRVILEMAPNFAPEHVANIKLLAQTHVFDNIAVLRVQDNYVVQWGDPTEKKDLGAIKKNLPPEYARPAQDVTFTALPDGDVYAAEVGFSNGFPAARDEGGRQIWLTHCYGMVGVGRDMPPDTGNGAELYAVLGHAPRHLDRNLAVVGRVIQGMDLLAALPRGTENMGFYAKTLAMPAITHVRLAADMPEQEKPNLQILRTDTMTWHNYVQSRRARQEAFFVEPTGKLELCNVLPPVRVKKP